MRILITGGLGQLGRALQVTLSNHELVIVDLPDVDITKRVAIEKVVVQARPEIVIHCAAYTDVDDSARNPDLAYKVNALGTQNVALACLATGAIMAHISTNEVFSGQEPGGYEEWMPIEPVNPYGRSKAAAEYHVRQLIDRAYVIRTAWLYGPGGRNFIHAIINRARSGNPLQVVADEIGNPTYVNDLATAIGQLITTGQYGTYHFTNTGSCSRWSFANQILQLNGLEEVPNIPILSNQYRRASTPPRYGALKNINGALLGITLRPWSEALADFLKNHPVNQA